MSLLLSNAPLFYPSARTWMWNYCIYLGPFTNSEGTNFDLGIHLSEGEEDNPSAAIVYGDVAGNYYSGKIGNAEEITGIHGEIYKETRNRAIALGLFKAN